MATVDGSNIFLCNSSINLSYEPELQVAIEGYTSNTVAIIKIAIVLEV